MKHLLQTNAGRKCYCSTPTYCLDGADALQDVLVQGRSGGRGREMPLPGVQLNTQIALGAEIAMLRVRWMLLDAQVSFLGGVRLFAWGSKHRGVSHENQPKTQAAHRNFH